MMMMMMKPSLCRFRFMIIMKFNLLGLDVQERRPLSKENGAKDCENWFIYVNNTTAQDIDSRAGKKSAWSKGGYPKAPSESRWKELLPMSVYLSPRCSFSSRTHGVVLTLIMRFIICSHVYIPSFGRWGLLSWRHQLGYHWRRNYSALCLKINK